MMTAPRIAVVTGATSGIGRATAVRLGRDGFHVVACGRDPVRGAAAVAAVVASGGSAAFRAFDVTSEADWEGIVTAAEQEFGAVHALSNNAGIFLPQGVEETTVELFHRITDINQLGVLLGMRSVIPAMRRVGGGSIVNFSSIYGITGSGLATAYQGTKGAVRLMTKTAAIEYATENIRVNSLHPTMIDTPLIRNGVGEAELNRLLKLVPMQRIGQADEVAYPALFLLSDEASLITGAELAVDGGYVAGAPIPA